MGWGMFQQGACLQASFPGQGVYGLSDYRCDIFFQEYQALSEGLRACYLSPSGPHSGLAQGPGGRAAGFPQPRAGTLGNGGVSPVWEASLGLCALQGLPGGVGCRAAPRECRHRPTLSSCLLLLQSRDLDKNEQTKTKHFWQNGNPMGLVLVFGFALELGELNW